MGLIAPLAALLGLEVSSVASRARYLIVVYGIIALCLCMGVGFLLAAGYMALADFWSPIIAALSIGGFFLFVALCVYVGTVTAENKRKREITDKRKTSETGALLTTAAMTALPMIAKSPKLLRLGIPAAAIAAFALLRSRND